MKEEFVDYVLRQVKKGAGAFVVVNTANMGFVAYAVTGGMDELTKVCHENCLPREERECYIFGLKESVK